ncbi:hypothetical protein MRB53_033831 [Persea americana]|uniref:Uncharacterized protein n=1 Tax=Persea americana TaxID=3435 RepID=A0ACC2KVK7_PERAE|nr:hypothetical protein MRB53_033831 [Persea americana]
MAVIFGLLIPVEKGNSRMHIPSYFGKFYPLKFIQIEALILLQETDRIPQFPDLWRYKEGYIPKIPMVPILK